MVTLKSCCCFKLETGGIIIAGLQLVGDVFMLVMCGMYLHIGVLCIEMSSADDDCLNLGSYLIVVVVILTLLCIAFAFIAWLCIKGIETRNHSKVMPMMILLGITTLLSPLQVLISFSVIDIVKALVSGVIYGYCFLVIYSLYKVFRREHESGGSNRPNVRYQVAGKV